MVPTWNYAVVHAYGAIRIIEDADWLLRSRERAERTRTRRALAEPWAVTDAPEPFVAAQLRGIVGLEIAISRIEGKWKVSQNRPVPDRVGVAKGLREQAGADSDMASWWRRRSEAIAPKSTPHLHLPSLSGRPPLDRHVPRLFRHTPEPTLDSGKRAQVKSPSPGVVRIGVERDVGDGIAVAGEPVRPRKPLLHHAEGAVSSSSRLASRSGVR